MTNIAIFIPCRQGSKGIKDKNIKTLGGKPLVAWTIESALQAEIGRVIVSTDSKKYAEICEKFGAEVMFVEPAEAKKRGIHQDDSSMFDVLKSEIPRIKPIPEIIVLLQPTVPFRMQDEIRKSVQYLNGYDSLITVEKVPEKWNPAQVIVKNRFIELRMADGSSIKNRITRRQDFPEAYIPTGSVYAFYTKNLDKGSFYGDIINLIESKPTININDEASFKLAKEILKL